MISLLCVILFALSVVDASRCRPSYTSVGMGSNTTTLGTDSPASVPTSSPASVSFPSQTPEVPVYMNTTSLDTSNGTLSVSTSITAPGTPTSSSGLTTSADSSTPATDFTGASSTTSSTGSSTASSTTSSITVAETDSSPSSADSINVTSTPSSDYSTQSTTTSTSIPTDSSTTSTTSSSSSSSLDPVPSPTGIPFTCPPEGFVTTQDSIGTYSLTTGQVTFFARIKSPTNEALIVNAIGYNTADNYLYFSANAGPGHVARLYPDGNTEYLLDLIPGQIGDVDDNGYYWMISTFSNEIYQVDIDRTRPETYATVVTTTSLGASGLGSAIINDWAFVPGAGRYLWAVGTAGGGDPTTVVLRFSMQMLKFEVFARYNNIVTDGGFSEHFAVGDGSLYVLDDKTGALYKFFITEAGRLPERVRERGFGTTASDGARCASNSDLA